MARLLTLTTVCMVSLAIGMSVRFPNGFAGSAEHSELAPFDSSTAVAVVIPQEESPETVAATSDDAEEYALVFPAERTAVRAAASGTLSEVAVRVGESISGDQIVARVREDEVRADLKQQISHAAVAKCRIRAAQADLDLAEYEHGLKEKLSRARTMSAAELVASERRVDAARARLDAAKEEMTMALHGADRVEESLERYEVAAPFAGRVTEVACHPNQYVEEGDIILWVESHERRLKVHVSPERIEERGPLHASVLLRGEWRDVHNGMPRPSYNPDGTVTVVFELGSSDEFVPGQVLQAKVSAGDSN